MGVLEGLSIGDVTVSLQSCVKNIGITAHTDARQNESQGENEYRGSQSRFSTPSKAPTSQRRMCRWSGWMPASGITCNASTARLTITVPRTVTWYASTPQAMPGVEREAATERISDRIEGWFPSPKPIGSPYCGRMVVGSPVTLSTTEP